MARTRCSRELNGAYPTPIELSFERGTPHEAPREKRLCKFCDPSWISVSTLTSRSASSAWRFCLSHALDPSTAISLMGSTSLSTLPIARPARKICIGETTVPPPNAGDAWPPHSRALSTLWWRISPHRRLYSTQRLRDKVSARASQIESGWPKPFRSTISISFEASSGDKTRSNIVLLTEVYAFLCPP